MSPWRFLMGFTQTLLVYQIKHPQTVNRLIRVFAVSPKRAIFGPTVIGLFFIFLPKEHYPKICHGFHKTPCIFNFAASQLVLM